MQGPTTSSDYCDTINFAGLDFNVMEATLASIESQSLTPLVKEELKLRIQTKRLAAGKKELPKTVFKEPEKYELTAEEEEKREHRRKLNREAATKCRQKKKTAKESVNTQQAELELRNFSLKRKVEDLETEKRSIITKLKDSGIRLPPGFSLCSSEKPPPTEKLQCSHSTEPPQSISDQPSTSSGIYHMDQGQQMSRRFSCNDVRPPPPPYPYIPRRVSADGFPFSVYMDVQPPATHDSVSTHDAHPPSDVVYTAANFPCFPQVSLVPQASAQTHRDPVYATAEAKDGSSSFHETFMPFEQYISDIPVCSNGATTITVDEFDFLADDQDMVKKLLAVSEDTSVHNACVTGMETVSSVPVEYFVQLADIGEDEATVPGSLDACVNPTSPSFY
ncbi:uncharacterized protein LOC128209284 isoform X2 [Mya arenaria]|nr:uncharacterized protein LOC128209284 isoform X2 [Mya arenaria]XP_052769215.1 uncharacterized protein LOC128209284 isoform X2 [Mya arenaria]